MSNGPLIGRPPSGDQYLAKIVSVLNEELLIRNVEILGWRPSGKGLRLRFFARTPWVQVHVQSTTVGGGGYTYTPGTFAVSEEIDCRASRQQDVTTADLADGTYIAYLVPVEYDAAGTKILYDGQSGRPDHMSFADIGSFTGVSTVAERWSVLTLGKPGLSPLPDGVLSQGDQAALSGLYAGIAY